MITFAILCCTFIGCCRAPANQAATIFWCGIFAALVANA